MVKIDLAWPRYDEILAGSDILFIRDRISHIDLQQRRVSLDSGLRYDYDRFEVKGKAGHLIRQATYLEMLPTPLRNFKATTEWLTEGVFQQFVDS
ncbi:hypothetical protein H1P_360006 [Hyella patelloides LEGE 07179]|uniref:Uncharacterized protein n=1 Tax=Hyella patelloides LEGE 07179 TaxID=945734 RepID=A0A563VW79_9CYAN|nr:hypothetical protein [Hyella patelloides]VEP15671.1 hypothetical protein H1P_360006 [Hyella patelloides LEGE 07179]